MFDEQADPRIRAETGVIPSLDSASTAGSEVYVYLHTLRSFARLRVFCAPVCACSFCGTEAYLAPEMILRLPYGASVDFWQYGCFVYELYAGRSPFWLPRKPRKFIRENILNGVFAYPSVVPEPAKGITGALLQVCAPRVTVSYNLFRVVGDLIV